MNKLSKITLLFFVAYFIFFGFVSFAMADAYSDCMKNCDPNDVACTEACAHAGDSPASGSSGGSTELKNPLGTVKSPADLIGNILNALLGVVGSVALGVFVLGGFNWITAAGNDEKIKKGKDMIVWASLGLAVIFASYAMVRFVIGAIAGGTGAGDVPDIPGPSAIETTDKILLI